MGDQAVQEVRSVLLADRGLLGGLGRVEWEVMVMEVLRPGRILSLQGNSGNQE
jgi:hypothetical protein